MAVVSTPQAVTTIARTVAIIVIVEAVALNRPSDRASCQAARDAVRSLIAQRLVRPARRLFVLAILAMDVILTATETELAANDRPFRAYPHRSERQ